MSGGLGFLLGIEVHFELGRASNLLAKPVEHRVEAPHARRTMGALVFAGGTHGTTGTAIAAAGHQVRFRG